jgi:uncharacterized protein (DUF2267 family)
LDKYQLIDAIITKVDAQTDARGVARCAMTVEIVQTLNALRDLLQKEEAAHAEADPE